jgi:hypothetical protein
MQICYVRDHYISMQLQVNELSTECNHLRCRIGYTGNVTGIAQDGDNRVTGLASADVPAANIQVALEKYQMIPCGGSGLLSSASMLMGPALIF